MQKKIVAVAGGIGVGKSVVCRILRAMGYEVYDCDSRAKAIMDSDAGIKAAIAMRVTPAAIDAQGNLDRIALADVVFSDKERLSALNSIVHAAVRDDLRRWVAAVPADVVFVETAILYQSGLDRMVDEVWEVTAPQDVRIGRVCRRSNLTPAQVKARIASQRVQGHTPHKNTVNIVNDGRKSLLQQIAHLLS